MSRETRLRTGGGGGAAAAASAKQAPAAKKPKPTPLSPLEFDDAIPEGEWTYPGFSNSLDRNRATLRLPNGYRNDVILAWTHIDIGDQRVVICVGDVLQYVVKRVEETAVVTKVTDLLSMNGENITTDTVITMRRILRPNPMMRASAARPPAKVEGIEFELDANTQHRVTHRADFNGLPTDYREAVIEAVTEDLELTDAAIDGIRVQPSHDAIHYIVTREQMDGESALRQTLLHTILHFRCHQLTHLASTPADQTKVTVIMKEVLARCALEYIPGAPVSVVQQVVPEFRVCETPPRKEVAERLPPWVRGAVMPNTTTPAVPQPVEKPRTKAKPGGGAAKSGARGPKGLKDDGASAARPKAETAGGDSAAESRKDAEITRKDAEIESLRRLVSQTQTALVLAGAHIETLNTAVKTANKNMKHLARRAREPSFEMKAELDDDFKIIPAKMPEPLRAALEAAGGVRRVSMGGES